MYRVAAKATDLATQEFLCWLTWHVHNVGFVELLRFWAPALGCGGCCLHCMRRYGFFRCNKHGQRDERAPCAWHSGQRRASVCILAYLCRFSLVCMCTSPPTAMFRLGAPMPPAVLGSQNHAGAHSRPTADLIRAISCPWPDSKRARTAERHTGFAPQIGRRTRITAHSPMTQLRAR